MAAGENAALFQQNIQPHLKCGYTLARWLSGNNIDADDILQEAAIRAFRFCRDQRNIGSRAWFLKIVRNEAMTFLRRKNRSKSHGEIALDSTADSADQPEQDFMIRATIDDVRGAIASLPADYASIVIMRDIQQLSYDEIAIAMDVPIGTVMSRLHRARSRLKIILQERGHP